MLAFAWLCCICMCMWSNCCNIFYHQFESFGSKKQWKSLKRRKKCRKKTRRITFVYCSWRQIRICKVINWCYLRFVTVLNPNRKLGTMKYFKRLRIIMEHWNIGKKNGNENKKCESSNQAKKTNQLYCGIERESKRNMHKAQKIFFMYFLICIRVEFW